MTVLGSFLLCLGLTVGLVVGYTLGDHYGWLQGRRDQTKQLKKHLHQRN